MEYTMNFKGKSVLITGAASGIGAELVKGFVSNGATVYAVDRNQNTLEGTLEQIRADFPECTVYPIIADLTVESDIAAIVEAVKAATNRVDILVNNAGIGHYAYSINETREDWDRLIGINLTAQFFCAQAIANSFMIPQRYGKIVNMCSTGGLIGIPSCAAYSASKGAAIQMTKSLAGEWARFNIRVNCVCPGYVETPLIKGRMENEKWMSYTLAKNPMRRLAKPEDIVGPVLFLSSNLAEYVNGASIVVDGGASSCS